MRVPGKIAGFAVKSLFKKPSTIQYPASGDAKLPVERNYRGKIVYDPTDCVGCKLCMKDCPTGAIQIFNDGTVKERKMRAELDVSKCIFCGQCVASCRKNSLRNSDEINLSTLSKEDLKTKL